MDLEKKVESKASEIFGLGSFYFPLHWKLESTVAWRYVDGLVIDFANIRKPKAQVIEYETAPYDLQHIENQLRDFHRALNDDTEDHARIIDKVYDELRRSPEAFQKAKVLVGKDADLHSLVANALRRNHSILLVLDDLFPTGNMDYPKRLADRVKDIPTDIEVLEFKTFGKDGELFHYYSFPLGR